jgi:DnaK suppressor protein
MTVQAHQMLVSRRDALRRALQPGATPERSARFALQEHRELEEVEGALARIAAGRFGTCERCGGAIGRQRLRAVPEARHCLACTQPTELAPVER